MLLSDISIKRPVLMTMAIMTFVVIGLFSFLRLGIDLMPRIDFPFVSIVTVYPGAGPEEIETLINKPMEEEISSVGGVKNLYTIAQEGVSIVLVELQLGQNVDIAAIDVKDKIDAIRRNLPEDMEDPMVQKFEFGALPILDLSVTGPLPLEELFVIADKQVKAELGKIPGLASVDIIGEKEREIEISLSAQKLRAYGTSPLQVVGALAVENLTIPAGRIERGWKEYTLRLAGEFNDIAQIAATRIQTPGGIIRLDQIAQVKDGFAEMRELARFNGESSIGLELVKRSDANTVQVANQVKRTLELLKTRLPQGVSIGIARDNSRFIKDTVADVNSNLVLGILFTAAVLFLFLHNWGGTIIAALAMPISVIATFTLISAAGFTLNVMSLMGLAISIGILVVNATVVLENIERMKAEGLSDSEAASKGTSEIALAVAASTLTNIVVFTPMAFMRGMIGPIFQQFGLTVAFATIFSLFISFTLTPMMAARPIKKAIYPLAGIIIIAATWAYVSRLAALWTIGVLVLIAVLNQTGLLKRFTNLWDRWYLEFENDYRNALRWSIDHRFLFLSGVALLFLFGLSLFKFIGSEFFPSYDERALAVTIEMPAGTRMEETNKVLSRVESEVVKFPEVKTIYSTLGKSSSGHFGGGQGVQYGQMFAILRPVEEGNYPPTSRVVKDLRTRLADIPAAKIIASEASQFGGGEAGADLEILLQGDNMDDLAKASDQVMEIMNAHGKLVNVNSNWELGKPEIVIRPDRARLFDRGGTIQDVAMTLRTLYEGTVATRYREGGDEFDVKVRLMAEDRSSIDRVGELLIPLPGGFVPLKEVASVEYASGPTQVSRKNKQRVVTVSANVGSGTTGQIQRELTRTLELPPIPASQQMKDIITGQSSVTARYSPKLPAGVTVFFGGEAEMMAESFASLLQALVLASILTYMLMAAMLESYRYPLIIMATLPLALIGITIALVMTGKSISIFSLMSIVMLVGIVVNNAILLIDYTVELRNRGRGLRDAVLEACPIRLRPIIMSTVATILGMLPLALGIGAGGELRSPMAIVAIGGLISSTVLALFVIPVLFMVMEARGERKKMGRV